MDLSSIVDMLRDDDPSAAALLVSVLGPQLYPYAAEVAPDLSQADREQAVEAAVAEVARRIDDYDERRATLQTWARGFVRNKVRAQRARLPGGAPAAPLADDTAGAVPPAQETGDAARDAHLSEIVLTHLTDAEYVLLRLRLSERLSHALIAEHVGVREETVKKRYQRIIAKLAAATRGDPQLDPAAVPTRGT